MFASNTPAWEMEKSKLDITGILIINTMVLVLFCTFIAPIRMDNVKSKFLIGFFGLFSATLATVRYFFLELNYLYSITIPNNFFKSKSDSYVL